MPRRVGRGGGERARRRARARATAARRRRARCSRRRGRALRTRCPARALALPVGQRGAAAAARARSSATRCVQRVRRHCVRGLSRRRTRRSKRTVVAHRHAPAVEVVVGAAAPRPARRCRNRAPGCRTRRAARTKRSRRCMPCRRSVPCSAPPAAAGRWCTDRKGTSRRESARRRRSAGRARSACNAGGRRFPALRVDSFRRTWRRPSGNATTSPSASGTCPINDLAPARVQRERELRIGSIQRR